MVRLSWARRALRILGRLVPRRERGEWLLEWSAELDHVVERGVAGGCARVTLGRLVAAAEDALRFGLSRRGRGALAGLAYDVRFALRSFARSPLFTAAVIMTLGLGIGATTAVFSVTDAAVLRPLPVSDPDRLVMIVPQAEGARFVMFNPLFEEIRREQTSLTGMFAVSDEPYLKVTLDSGAAPEYVRGVKVSGNYFEVLGVTPAAGRLLTDADDALPGEPRSASCAGVISYDFWDRRYRREASAIGRTVRVGTETCTIVGVAPLNFRSHQLGFAPDVWLPLRRLSGRELLGNYRLAFYSGMMGRLRDGVSRERAESELTALYQRAVASAPPDPDGERIEPADYTIRLADGRSGLDLLRREFGQSLGLVLGVVVIVLLIAAVNVATLLLARGAARESELTTRAALGASRFRLIRQLALDGAVLALLGGIVGITLAWLGTPALASAVSVSWLPIVLDVSPDHRVLAAAVLVTGLTALVTALVPALRLGRRDLQTEIRAGGRTASGRSGRRLMRGLVAAQLALSLPLVTVAGLLVQTMVRLLRVDVGFEPDQVVVLHVGRDESPSHLDMQRAALYMTLDERLNNIAGVRAAGVSWLGLFGGSDLRLSVFDPAQPSDESGAHVDYVSSRYFESVGMDLIRGRFFTRVDRDGAQRVMVVNEAFVRERSPGRDALGRQFALSLDGQRDRPFTIIGIVRDAKYNDLRETSTRPMVWTPLAQTPYPISTVSLRVEPSAQAEVVHEAGRVISEADPQLLVRSATTLSAQVSQTTARERLVLQLASGFGGLALLLSAIGLYGTLAYSVARRTREVGVRLALGATSEEIVRLVLGQASRLALFSLLAGVPLALGAGFALRSFLFGVTPHDPNTLLIACGVMTAVVILAASIPARRAADVDPMTALRYE